MDYKNLFLRLFSSILLLILYIFLYLFYPEKIFFLVSLIYFIIILEVMIFFKKYKLQIIAYILLSYCFLIYYNYTNFDPNDFTLIILCIIIFDSFSYLAGKFFGKNKIFKIISPKKTYEGLFGGILITNLVIFLFHLNFDIKNLSITHNIFFITNLIIISSFFGDLIESYFKRLNNLKDSSNFIPGHGGFFDRFDSFLLAIITISSLYFVF